MTTGKTIALTRRTLFGKVMSLLFNMLSRLVITFLPRLKVLGYHQKEIRNLILSENIIISILGVLCGVFPGYLFTDLIMHSCEPEAAYYPGMPTVQSVVLACVITFGFSMLIQLLLTRNVRKIDMVEALKSVE